MLSLKRNRFQYNSFMKIILPFIMSNLIGANFNNVSNGFGLDIGSRGSGVFLIRQYLDNEKPIGLNLELRFYDIKGENETVFYDYYTGTYQSISGKSLFLCPLFLGLNYYPFKDKIENNFLPFLTSRAGLVFILDGNDSGSFSQRWSNPTFKISPGGYFGCGIDFKYVSNSYVSASVGYEVLPADPSISSNLAKGLLIHIAFIRSIR